MPQVLQDTPKAGRELYRCEGVGATPPLLRNMVF